MAELFVAIYKGGDNNVPHWCFATRDDSGNERIFEALGSTGINFTYHTRAVDLDKSASLTRLVKIGRIEADVWPETPEVFKSVPMSRASGWNCQNWVREGIDKLREKDYLEEDTAGTAYIMSKYQKKWKDY